jgi:hypothetical protein|nr:MAG TPA: YopX protein [Caudoviricetes sp.]DAS49629.1 MAG TPA: YopX protein [Caudoviricetes sp.]
MKREILFRAKGSGKWRYGSYLHFDKKPINDCCNNKYKDFIVTNGMYGEHYYPITELSSLGQYTGLKDKNGNKIFEGDIIKTPRGFIGEVVFGRAEEECTHRLFRRMVTDVFTTYGWVFKRADGFTIAIDDEILQGELIGNVTDNPELIK